MNPIRRACTRAEPKEDRAAADTFKKALPYSIRSDMHSTSLILGVLELPFLLLCVYFAFRTAMALKGGVFGRGMMLLAAGFSVMAVGHAHMQLEHYLGLNLFDTLLGQTAGHVAWITALVITWALSGIGFYQILRASRRAAGV